MRMYDIIHKKRQGQHLTKEEIKFFVKGYANDEIPDYQAAALLMAIFFMDMNIEETTELTLAMAHSGDMVDLSPISGIKVDKHSTGGVGDKTTLVITPIVASCGPKIAKMSGRGLGHTGGTVDKLESIPGLKTSFTMEEFFDIVNKTGISVIGQSGNLAPADKKLYALRDVTATIDKIPLIASSIMSKKLAAGSDCILLDVKCGSGAFMKDIESAVELASIMVNIAENAGRRCTALVTDMDVPLGENVGNILEVMEAIDVMRGHGPEDLRHECIELSAEMLHLAGMGSLDECRNLAENSIKTGKAFDKFVEMVEGQGGDSSYVTDTSKFEKARYTHEVKALKSGYIVDMDTEKCGTSAVVLGAGRKTMDSVIDFAAGLKIKAKIGDCVEEGQTIAVLLTNNEKSLKEAEKLYLEAIVIGDVKPEKRLQVMARVDKHTKTIY
ncbi:thymidine phosphorylase [Proteocatella sphenisci]|uniref:thymidine phosphorylase n=1 Tax=Proteocatella sphenisci TaxID=181070 RepID=UPI00049120A2|nr:thymidine phosphorylase [Proteocatella sphenisci]